MMDEMLSNSGEWEDWDEDDWERFLQQADVRTAKYQELFETLDGHPRRDELIAREMGWDQFFEQCRFEGGDCDNCPHRFDCERHELIRLVSGDDEDGDEDLAEEFEEIWKIPAFREGHDFSLRLQQYFESNGNGDLRHDEDVLRALSAASMVPAQIAGGHGIGYDKDSLCGNIANCKRALKNLGICFSLLTDLHTRQIIPFERLCDLKSDAESLRAEVQHWIEDLRSRVWWR